MTDAPEYILKYRNDKASVLVGLVQTEGALLKPALFF